MDISIQINLDRMLYQHLLRLLQAPGVTPLEILMTVLGYANSELLRDLETQAPDVADRTWTLILACLEFLERNYGHFNP